MPTVFYSWQSDAPNKTNRSFIETALEIAVKDLNAELQEAERDDDVELTQDTQGVPGTPDIARVILKKIDQCDVFVCDVSLVLDADCALPGKERQSPNPNVLIELGYAMKALGEGRVLMLFNTALGTVERLPFDLRTRRPVQYNAAPSDTDLSSKRAVLGKDLSKRISEVLNSAANPTQSMSLLETAQNAVESQSPNRRVQVRRAVENLVEQIQEPALRGKYEDTFRIHRDFLSLVQVAIDHNDGDALDGMVRGLSNLAKQYWVPKGHSGYVPSGQHDVYRFSGRCWLLLFTAAMMRDGEWRLLSTFLKSTIVVRNPEYGNPGERPLIYLNQRPMHLAQASRSSGRRSLFADFAKNMLDDEILRFDIEIDELIDADLLLGLLKVEEFGFNVPELVVYMEFHSTNAFINSLRRKERAEIVADIVGLSNLDQLRLRVEDLKQMLGSWLKPDSPLDYFDTTEIGTQVR